MEIQGKVIAVLPERSGVSARGEWKSQSYVIETHEAYPKQMVFDVFGADRIAQFNIKSGEEITVSFDITAHEYNGRWFNNIRAWNVVKTDPASVSQNAAPAGVQSPIPPQQPASAPQQPASGTTAPFPPQQPAGDNEGDDDLPF